LAPVVVAVAVALVSADVTDQPQDDVTYTDGMAGMVADVLREQGAELPAEQRERLAGAQALIDAIKAMRPTAARPCPTVQVHYIDGPSPVRQFARHAAAANQCALHLFFGHTITGDDAVIANVMKPLNDAPSVPEPARQARIGVWGCSGAAYNAALPPERRVSAAGSAARPCPIAEILADAAADLPGVLATDAAAMCEACGNTAVVHLYFVEEERGEGGNGLGYASW
jgi:hypothetical protein